MVVVAVAVCRARSCLRRWCWAAPPAPAACRAPTWSPPSLPAGTRRRGRPPAPSNFGPRCPPPTPPGLDRRDVVVPHQLQIVCANRCLLCTVTVQNLDRTVLYVQ